MGRRKKQAAGMGKSLIKDRFRGKPTRGNDSFLHTTEMNDGYDGRTLNLQSVTEQSSMDDFLLTAELADRDFTAEKGNVQLVTPQLNSGVLSGEKLKQVRAAQHLHKSLLRIPRRPPWNESTPADKLKQDEHTTFLEWRRQLGRLQEEEHIVITPYEKNLEFWRQLWRVIERSDVVVQIVDARNPLLFWCPDLNSYVKEVDSKKQSLLLINKADLLAASQRQAWADYFKSKGIHVVFWSAVEESARIEREKRAQEQEPVETTSVTDVNTDSCEDDDDDDDFHNETQAEPHEEGDSDSDGYETIEETTDDEADCETGSADQPSERQMSQKQVTSSSLQNSEDLLSLFRRTAITHYLPGVTTVGMVGYPNVGKSSTINAILQTKRVPVSATPGRTKHFQTLYVEKDLMLCDCPGLVFPSFVDSKAELVVNGILPIDQLQDSEPPVELVCNRIGRSVFESSYHINLPPPEEWEDPDKSPSAYDLLHVYGLLRGFMSHKGNPDRPRAARYILKDYVNGKLLFCHPPPGIEAEVFQKPPYGEDRKLNIPAKPSCQKTTHEKKTEALDREFFEQLSIKAHAKGPNAVGDYVRTEALRQVGAETSSTQEYQQKKPWKKHNNRNKKEKLRRVYADLDRH